MAQVIVKLSYHAGVSERDEKITFVSYDFEHIGNAIRFCRTACSCTAKVDGREKSKCSLYSFNVDGEDLTNELKSLEGLGGHA